VTGVFLRGTGARWSGDGRNMGNGRGRQKCHISLYYSDLQPLQQIPGRDANDRNERNKRYERNKRDKRYKRNKRNER
jgi:hypothetical protein